MAPLTLSPRQRSELEYLATHNPVAKERCRAQALLWLDEGETAEQVAESLRVSRRTVYYWLERFHDRDGLDLGSGWPTPRARADPGRGTVASTPGSPR